MDYNQMLFALRVHEIVDEQLRKDAKLQNTDADEFITKDRYEEYVWRTVRQISATAEIIQSTPLEKKHRASYFDLS